MSTPLSKAAKWKILLPNGRRVKASSFYVDSATGKIVGIMTRAGFCHAENIVEKEDGWEFSGETTNHPSNGDNWKKFKVKNREGKYRGSVTEIWIDPIALCVTKFECAISFFGKFSRKRIYGADDIFDVKPERKTIFVEEDSRIFQAQGEKVLSI